MRLKPMTLRVQNRCVFCWSFLPVGSKVMGKYDYDFNKVLVACAGCVALIEDQRKKQVAKKSGRVVFGRWTK